jgi:hypothetical protein
MAFGETPFSRHTRNSRPELSRYRFPRCLRPRCVVRRRLFRQPSQHSLQIASSLPFQR